MQGTWQAPRLTEPPGVPPALGFPVQLEKCSRALGFGDTERRQSVPGLFGCDTSSPTFQVCLQDLSRSGGPMLPHSQHCQAGPSFSSRSESAILRSFPPRGGGVSFQEVLKNKYHYCGLHQTFWILHFIFSHIIAKSVCPIQQS